MHPLDADEPLLQEEIGRSRFVIHPVRYHDVYDMGEIAEEALWTTGEVDLSRDQSDLRKLTEKQRHVIEMVLAFFAASDGIVIENLCESFLCKVKMPEARYFYGIQAGIETVHSKMYSLLLDCYVSDVDQRHRLFNAVTELPSIQRKAEWALSYIDSSKPFAMQLLAYACVEGIYFSSSFAFIFYVKTLGMLPGLTFSNELISRDEGLHTEFAVLLYKKYIKHRLSEEDAHAIVRSAVECEQLFVDTCLPDMLLGMNQKLMKQYVEFVADRLLKSVGYAPIYAATNPFDFMDNLSTETKSNFFEKRVAEYKRSGVRKPVGAQTEGKPVFSRSAAF